MKGINRFAFFWPIPAIHNSWLLELEWLLGGLRFSKIAIR